MPQERAEKGSDDGARFSPTIELVTLARAVDVQLAALLEPHGLTLRTYGLLGRIAVTPGLSLSDLGRRSHLTVPRVQTAIRSLVAAGWVRATTEASGMPSQVSATPAGAALLDRLGAGIDALDATTFDSPGGRALSTALIAIAAERTGPATPGDTD